MGTERRAFFAVGQLIALLCVAAALAGCNAAKDCRPGTVFISFELPLSVSLPASITVVVTVEGIDSPTPLTVTHREATIEVHFPSGYPRGKVTRFSVRDSGGTELLAWSGALQGACDAVRLTPQAEQQDGGDDAAVSDDLVSAIENDLSKGNDLAEVTDASTVDSSGGTDLNSIRCEEISVSTLAGNGQASFFDGTGGAEGNTRFNGPIGVAADAIWVYVSESTHRVRKIATDGSTTTLAGNGSMGFADGTGGPTGTTEFFFPSGLAVDSGGNVFVGDQANYRIRKIASDGSTVTFSGNGTAGFFDGTGGAGGTTQFTAPVGVALHTDGFLYVADSGNHRIRKLTSAGASSTVAGNGAAGFFDGTGGASGTTQFGFVTHLVVDTTGTMFVIDSNHACIRKVLSDGTTTTLAGNGTEAHADGTGGRTGTASFEDIGGITFDDHGNLIVGDGPWLRRVDPDGTTSTIAGSATADFADGTACSAKFRRLAGLARRGKTIFAADTGDHRVRRIDLP